jgi:hypothetical protein
MMPVHGALVIQDLASCSTSMNRGCSSQSFSASWTSKNPRWREAEVNLITTADMSMDIYLFFDKRDVERVRRTRGEVQKDGDIKEECRSRFKGRQRSARHTEEDGPGILAMWNTEGRGDGRE